MVYSIGLRGFRMLFGCDKFRAFGDRGWLSERLAAAKPLLAARHCS